MRKLSSKKNNIWKKLSRYSKAEISPKFIQMRERYKLITAQYRAAVRKYFSEKEFQLTQIRNDKAFFAYANKRISPAINVAPLKNSNGNLIVDEAEKAKLLNDFFASVFTKDNGIVPASMVNTRNSMKLSNIVFSSDVVREALSNLKPKFSSGADGFPSILFKNLADFLCEPLSILFTVSLHTNSVPNEWSKSLVTPLFKKGSLSDPKNYRPVALTCVACRVMERIVKDVIVSHLSAHQLIHKKQHGFISRHSTVTQLLECVELWQSQRDFGVPTDVVYLDYSKAFDSVSHQKLVFKLESVGISGNLLLWCRSFLSNRLQAVKLGSTVSEYIPVTSGVPQGSVLGPLFFLVFINDVAELPIHGDLRLFADDIKVFNSIRCQNDSNDLSADLTQILQWSNQWQLSLNLRKCAVLNFGLKSGVNSYSVCDVQLETVDSQLDLGVLMSKSCSFSPHCVNITNQAMCRVNTIFRGFKCRRHSLLVKAFLCYVRPILEYACEVWNPFLQRDILLIESVQRNFTRRLPRLSALNYEKRLQFLGLELLESRRIKADLLMCFKIVRGFVDLRFEDFFNYAKSHSTRGHSRKLEIPPRNSDLRANSFSVRVVPYWNSLDQSVVDSRNIAVFKSHIRVLSFPELFVKYS
jgi:hypothetical protein